MSKKPKPMQCPHNEWVFCHHKTCGSCGWNPTVSQERNEKLLGKEKQNEDQNGNERRRNV